MNWRASCTECDFAFTSSAFGDVYERGRDHEDNTGHDVEGSRVPEVDQDDVEFQPASEVAGTNGTGVSGR